MNFASENQTERLFRFNVMSTPDEYPPGRSRRLFQKTHDKCWQCTYTASFTLCIMYREVIFVVSSAQSVLKTEGQGTWEKTKTGIPWLKVQTISKFFAKSRTCHCVRSRFWVSNCFFHNLLVGGFNPSEKYESNWKSSPNRDQNKK